VVIILTVIIGGFIGFLLGRGTAPKEEIKFTVNELSCSDGKIQICEQKTATTTVLEEKQRCDEMGGTLNFEKNPVLLKDSRGFTYGSSDVKVG
jgi:hypothetical protein